jgi:hypothetical protein
MTIFLITVLFVAGVYRLAVGYVRRSLRSFGSAERVFGDIETASNAILDKRIPQSVARFVVSLVMQAGCGCFVRGFLMRHYLPRISVRYQDGNREVSVAMDDIDRLDPDVRKMIWDLIALIIVYDGYRHPMSGWIFRHALKAFDSPLAQAGIETRLETWQTAVSVLRRKSAKAYA